MRGAVTGTAYGGTCRGAALPDIEVCGKTGTSENPHGKDHSIFMDSLLIKSRRSPLPCLWKTPDSVLPMRCLSVN